MESELTRDETNKTGVREDTTIPQKDLKKFFCKQKNLKIGQKNIEKKLEKNIFCGPKSKIQQKNFLTNHLQFSFFKPKERAIERSDETASKTKTNIQTTIIK